MEYSERIAIRDFVLDYLIEDGGVIEAEAPFAMIDAFTGAPIPQGGPDTRLLSLLFGVFATIAHCEYTCDLTLWHERLVKEEA